MNKRKRKKHNMLWGFPVWKGYGDTSMHFFVKRKSKNHKRYNVRRLRELYKSRDYYHSWFDYDEDTGEYYEYTERY